MIRYQSPRPSVPVDGPIGFVCEIEHDGWGSGLAQGFLAHRGQGPGRAIGARARSRSCCEVRAVTIVRRHMAKSWRASMAWLERRYPDRWGPPRRQDIEFEPRKALCELLNMSEDELLGFASGVP